MQHKAGLNCNESSPQATSSGIEGPFCIVRGAGPLHCPFCRSVVQFGVVNTTRLSAEHDQHCHGHWVFAIWSLDFKWVYLLSPPHAFCLRHSTQQASFLDSYQQVLWSLPSHLYRSMCGHTTVACRLPPTPKAVPTMHCLQPTCSVALSTSSPLKACACGFHLHLQCPMLWI